MSVSHKKECIDSFRTPKPGIQVAIPNKINQYIIRCLQYQSSLSWGKMPVPRFFRTTYITFSGPGCPIKSCLGSLGISPAQHEARKLETSVTTKNKRKLPTFHDSENFEVKVTTVQLNVSSK
eukprot:scaffold2299_cov131-Cylindrotheca_fusiformis.AAC.29